MLIIELEQASVIGAVKIHSQRDAILRCIVAALPTPVPNAPPPASPEYRIP
jgi:hypothetical protein